MRKLCMILGVVAIAACSTRNEPVAAGESLVPEGTRVHTAPPPVHALLGYRERLELNSSQVAAIDSIGIWLDTANRALLTEMIDMREANGRRRRLSDRQSREYTAGSLPLMLKMGENNQAASSSVQALLSEQQRERVCELFQSPDERSRRRSGDQSTSSDRLQRTGGRGLGTEPDGQDAVWGWCAPTTGRTSSK